MEAVSVAKENPSAGLFSKPVVEVIKQRYSCRTYQTRPLAADLSKKLGDFCTATSIGPLGYPARYELINASEQDPQVLRSLGTYGFIQGASAYLAGAMPRDNFNPEDYGYMLEKIILFATDLGLGTCWLGGTFTKSSFAKKINATANELVPAVSPVGYIAEKPRRIETWLKKRRGQKKRFSWPDIFFDAEYGNPLDGNELNGYRDALEMVRIGPSASNRQPWRVILRDNRWHFYLQRTPGYRENPLTRWTTVADLQRIDMGIAMSHFELTAREAGIEGTWIVEDPGLQLPDENIEYTVSWVG
jgi:nitroreductase